MDNIALERDTELLEIPIAAANAFDAVLGQEAGLRKARQHFQGDLGKMHTVSFGKWGTVSLANTPYWACLFTARRWDAEHAEALSTAYRKAGLDKLVGSAGYQTAIESAKAAIKAAAATATTTKGTSWSPASLVTITVLGLMKNGGVLRHIAEAMTQISMRVDLQRSEIKRFPGWLERIEGDRALTVVKTEKGRELRSEDAAYLAKAGIQGPGARFVIHELSWSPDNTAKVFVPALALDDESVDAMEEVEAELRAAESPMPRPSAESSGDRATAQEQDEDSTSRRGLTQSADG